MFLRLINYLLVRILHLQNEIANLLFVQRGEISVYFSDLMIFSRHLGANDE
jgi:hypothetical protein